MVQAWCRLGVHLVRTRCALGVHLVYTWPALGVHLVHTGGSQVVNEVLQFVFTHHVTWPMPISSTLMLAEDLLARVDLILANIGNHSLIKPGPNDHDPSPSSCIRLVPGLTYALES